LARSKVNPSSIWWLRARLFSLEVKESAPAIDQLRKALGIVACLFGVGASKLSVCNELSAAWQRSH
jgi:hypothetical protein